ncbi:MAG TPA: glycosyltransferase family 39 protein [Gemmatimonadales bacterium]|nr:glycosyltransferase family 39 protein [Gemmatimonadales bacterium]
MSSRRLYLAVGASAFIANLPSLWNRFALDDIYIVVLDPLVRAPSGLWRAFGASYWAGNFNTTVYRPLTVATYALDWMVGSPIWFHFVNVVWHVAATLLVAHLARRWAGDAAALIAGVLFAVHPVHVEAVANIVGRNELMACVFVLVAVLAALEYERPLVSGLAFACGLLSKENAIVTPALIAFAWLLGVRPLPERRRLTWFVATWAIVAIGYFVLRYVVFRSYGAGIVAVAPVFNGASPLSVRLTAIAALGDVGRLLLFPLHLQADYSPAERTAVTTLVDARLLLGVLVVAIWGVLVVLAWKRRRALEAYGLGWIAIAYSPVANLVFPIGVLIAERTLYLPSAGLALAVGGTLRNLQGRSLALVAAALFVLGGARTVWRIPAWRDNAHATASLLDDAPLSYHTWDLAGWQLLWARQTDKALTAFLRSTELYPRDQRVYLAAADAAFTLKRPALADSLLGVADRICPQCPASYANQVGAARLRGDSASADSIAAHAARRKAAP